MCLDDAGGAAARGGGTRCAVSTSAATARPGAPTTASELVAHGGAGPVFDVVHHGVRLGAIELQVPGLHNALNATAALAVATGLGFSPGDVRAGLESFSGTRRRFDYRGTADGVRVYDDYAHHPTEIAATLRAAREVVGGGRLVVAFQPHRYSRTSLFVREFAEALGLADEVVVLEVYAAGEAPIPGASGQLIAACGAAAGGRRRVRAVVVPRGRGAGRPGAARRRRDDAGSGRHRDAGPRRARRAAQP